MMSWPINSQFLIMVVKLNKQTKMLKKIVATSVIKKPQRIETVIFLIIMVESL